MCLNSNILHSQGKIKNPSFKALLGQSYSTSFLTHCGTCLECRLRKTRDWIVRNYYENKSKTLLLYCCLTYSDSALPYDRLIDFSHFQKFNKRLRRKLNYYLGPGTYYTFMSCAEYGDLSLRPHFHFLMYTDPHLADSLLELLHPQQFKTYSGIPQFDDSLRPLYESHVLTSCWSFGNAIFTLPDSTFSPELITYLTVYSTKNDSIKKVTSLLKASRYHSQSLQNIIYRYPRHLNQLFFSKTHVSRETSKKTSSKITPYRRFLPKIDKKTYSDVKERIVSSTGLGYSTFYDFKEHYFDNGCVYINGIQYHIPLSWLYKLCNENYPPAIDYYLNNLFLYTESPEELRSRKERSAIKTHQLNSTSFTKDLLTPKNSVFKI